MGMSISVLGAGNGGQAMAGHFALLGHRVILYTSSQSKQIAIEQNGGIILSESIQGKGILKKVTTDIAEAVAHAEILMITTTADAHVNIINLMLPYLKKGQIIVLNPGRTLGALEVNRVLNAAGFDKKIFIAECQSLLYACRVEENGNVRIIGIKDKVLFSSYPSSDLTYVTKKLTAIFPSFTPVENVLITSLENIGAMFHPAIVLFNAASIERGEEFYFYNDMTPYVAAFLEKLDAERIALGKAFGISLKSVEEWISFAYKGIQGNDLCSKMRNNPAYYKIKAPKLIKSRLLTEDIPTGILPMTELGKMASVDMPVMNALCVIVESLINVDFKKNGRTLDSLGLTNLSKTSFLNQL
jgi:opine dehydrogenase